MIRYYCVKNDVFLIPPLLFPPAVQQIPVGQSDKRHETCWKNRKQTVPSAVFYVLLTILTSYLLYRNISKIIRWPHRRCLWALITNKNSKKPWKISYVDESFWSEAQTKDHHQTFRPRATGSKALTDDSAPLRHISVVQHVFFLTFLVLHQSSGWEQNWRHKHQSQVGRGIKIDFTSL